MKRQQKNESLLNRIRSLKENHPAWGYRRIWAYLKYRERLPVNQKRIHRLMKEQDLLVKPNWRLKAKRTGNFRFPTYNFLPITKSPVIFGHVSHFYLSGPLGKQLTVQPCENGKLKGKFGGKQK